MKKVPVLLTLLISLTLCACSDSSTSSAPAATSAPDTSVFSSVSSETESSSEAESIVQDNSETDKGDSSLTDEELERLADLTEEFETTEDFLNSGFIEEYYKDNISENEKLIPDCDDEVVSESVFAHYGSFWIAYKYNGKTYGICLVTHFNKQDKETGLYSNFESSEDLYNYRIEEDVPNTVYEYDKENDLVTVSIKSTGNDYVQKVTPTGKECDIFCWKEGGATLDEIIEFSKHLKF